MSLIGLTTSLAAPRLFSAYQKIQVESEERQVLNLLEAISYSAFVRNHDITAILDGDSISMKGKALLKLKHVTFPETELTFIRSGFCKHDRIEYRTGDETRFLSLPTL